MPDSAVASSAQRKEHFLREAIRQGLLDDSQLLAGFVDIAAVGETVTALNAAFPEHFVHTFAAKANSLRPLLSLLREHGMGCEVASPGELKAALDAGFDTSAIVHDEPAKTTRLLRFLLGNGIAFNIDNFEELQRVIELLDDKPPVSSIGFRINPQVGSGSIGAMSTATQTSKFGVALDDPGNRERLLQAYAAHPWLNSLHTHVGSQGCPLELMVAGVRKVAELAEAINAAAGRQQVRTLDIGGGLPVNFRDDSVSPTFADYAALLRSDVPALFNGNYIVKTEFGRSLLAKNGFIAARVEYTKSAGGRRIAITHAGAQTATRTVFMPEMWPIRISVFDNKGNARAGEPVEQDVAGPCCFAGDLLASARRLPQIEAGDYIMLHDTGAYYFSNHFFYNNLPAIAVYGARSEDLETAEFDCWRRQPTLEDILGVFV